MQEIWPENEKFICNPLLSSIPRKLDVWVWRKEKLLFAPITGEGPGRYLSSSVWDRHPLKVVVDLWPGKCEASSLIITPDLWASTHFCYCWTTPLWGAHFGDPLKIFLWARKERESWGDWWLMAGAEGITLDYEAFLGRPQSRWVFLVVILGQQ